MLFSRQLPNGSHDYFHIFSMFFSNCLIKNPKTTIALTFLTHNISGMGGVASFPYLCSLQFMNDSSYDWMKINFKTQVLENYSPEIDNSYCAFH
jgi:hypothetical protein